MNDNHPAGFMKTLHVPFHMSGTPLMFPPNRPLKDSSVAAEPNRGSFKIDDGDVIGRFCLNIVFGIMLVTWFSKGVHNYNTQRKPNFLKRRNFSGPFIQDCESRLISTIELYKLKLIQPSLATINSQKDSHLEMGRNTAAINQVEEREAIQAVSFVLCCFCSYHRFAWATVIVVLFILSSRKYGHDYLESTVCWILLMW